MPLIRQLQTNFSKGELSPFMEGHSDLVAYFEGASLIENYALNRYGGLSRAYGTRFIAETKDSSKDSILIPFEFSSTAAYILEVGDFYIRVFKNKALVQSGGSPVEIATPFAVADIRTIHYTQANDVLFFFHRNYQRRRLSRLSDTNWVLSAIIESPPPTSEADSDISGGTAALTPGATTGTGVPFTASTSVFLAGDVGRQIVHGASLAVITSVSSGTVVIADILDPFQNTSPIAAGSWFLRLSPQTTLDPTTKGPVGASVTLDAGAAAFRPADVGKYIHIYGGLVKITVYTSSTSIRGQIQSVMSEANAQNPPAADPGSWTMEVAAWSASMGWPSTGEFYQGRLYAAATASQPTTIWGSAADDFGNFARGPAADNAVEYTVAARKANRIEWLADNIRLFFGTTGSEHRLMGSGDTNALITGDTVPFVEALEQNGCASIQPVVAARSVLYVDRSRRRVFRLSYNSEHDGFFPEELTVAADHLTESLISLGPMAFQRSIDPRLYFTTNDGTLVMLTFSPLEKVVGFTRRVTQGSFRSVARIPDPAGGDDQVWVIVERAINGNTKRYVEMIEPNHEALTTRAWSSLQTDAAVVYSGSPTVTVTGLSHLEGALVDVVADGRAIGQKVVTGGVVTLTEAASEVEVGLPYHSSVQTMRPAIRDTVIDGLPRSWSKLSVRLYRSLGGTINGEPIQYPGHPIGTPQLYTGDRTVVGRLGWDTDGRITIKQMQPYPMNIISVFGTLAVGDRD